nr:hypothetical protein [Tanacetum cinerariifolium]
NLEYGHGQLVKKVIQVSDAEGQVQVMASQMVHVADRLEQVGAQAAVQQRDAQIQHLQTMVSETSSLSLSDWPNPECGMIPFVGSFARV